MAEAEAKNKQNKKSYEKSISCDLLITLMDRTNKDWPLQRVTGIISVLVSHVAILVQMELLQPLFDRSV